MKNIKWIEQYLDTSKYTDISSQHDACVIFMLPNTTNVLIVGDEDGDLGDGIAEQYTAILDEEYNTVVEGIEEVVAYLG